MVVTRVSSETQRSVVSDQQLLERYDIIERVEWTSWPVAGHLIGELAGGPRDAAV